MTLTGLYLLCKFLFISYSVTAVPAPSFISPVIFLSSSSFLACQPSSPEVLSPAQQTPSTPRSQTGLLFLSLSTILAPPSLSTLLVPTPVFFPLSG